MVKSEFYEVTRILFVHKENKNNKMYSTIHLLSVPLCQRGDEWLNTSLSDTEGQRGDEWLNTSPLCPSVSV